MSKTTKIVRFLHLEDNGNDAELIERRLRLATPECEIRVAASRAEFLDALKTEEFDMILSDNSIPGIDGVGALEVVHQRYPGLPFFFVSSAFRGERNVDKLKAAGATECILKSELAKLGPAVQHVLEPHTGNRSDLNQETLYSRGMERLVTAVQELSLARDMETVMDIVRQAARELTGADGATFVLKEGEMCFYADEDAIEPLWKGLRFPLNECVSGWAMMNRTEAVIEDIYVDQRVPQDAYRSTFVKSMVMVPIRTLDPLGAIGNYWADKHLPTSEEVKLLRALADTTAVALENIQVYQELEQRVKDRTAQLETMNKELEAFSYGVSHDLRAPLRHIDGFSQILLEDYASTLSDEAQAYLKRIRGATQRMAQLIEDLLALSRTTQAPVERKNINLSTMAQEILKELKADASDRQANFVIAKGLSVDCDPRLMRVVMDNLLSNAWKFTSKCAETRIEVGSMEIADGRIAYFVRDNGVGFDMNYAGKLFGVFQRLHSDKDFPGTGVGLATVQRIIHKHGGRIWAESVPNQGTNFYFTLS